jgi:hypothetical protein
MLNKAGRIRLILCDGIKRFSLSAKKEDPVAGEKGFWKLRRGDLIRVSGAQERAGGTSPAYAVSTETQIEVISETY